MSRYIVGQAGIVKNVVESLVAFTQEGFDVLLDPTGTTNVGDAYDPNDVKLDEFSAIGRKALFNHENWLRALTGRQQASQQAFNTALKDLVDNPAPAVDPASVLEMVKFTASITIGALTAATYTDKTFTIPGLLTTDLILSVTFTAGLTPNTISYIPLRVSANDTLAIRFEKITAGAVTPPAPQAITVLIAR